MDGIVCDRCGEGLLLNEDVRYVLSLEVKSMYDPMEITAKDLEGDLDQQIQDTIDALERIPAQDAERQVYFQGKYDLCGACQRAFLADPMFRPPSG